MKRSTFGWIEIILGILMVILGVYTLLNPASAINAIVIAYGILAILTGIADFVLYFRLEKLGGFGSAMMILSGILNLVVGILVLFNVGAGAWTLSILFPVWFLIHCIARLANLDFVKTYGSKLEYWVALIANILGIILAFMLLFNPFIPFSGAVALVYFVAAYLIVVGISSLVGGFGNLGRSSY